MFLSAPSLQLDPLWALTDEYTNDVRPEKCNLIIGVYRDETGVCPVMSSVRKAEQILANRATSKEYLGLSGNLAFNAEMNDLILGDPALIQRATTIQTVAGAGALRLLAELLATTGPDRTVHVGTPSYVNHLPILKAAGLRASEYPVAREGAIDGEAMLRAAHAAERGDVMLIQGCCHNPTGLNMPTRLWDELAEVMSARGVVPFIDQAYFGLGDGLQVDLAGMRRLLAAVPNAVVAVSGSKAWGLYAERVGCAIVLTDRADDGEYALGVMQVIARVDYSQPPAHGAKIVAEILDNPDLRADWTVELDGMRQRLTSLREGLVESIAERGGAAVFAKLIEQRGMFIGLPLTERQMDVLRSESAVYGLPNGRISIAGASEDRLDYLAQAIVSAARS